VRLKIETAQKYKKWQEFTLLYKNHLCFSTDGFLPTKWVGAVVFNPQVQQVVYQSDYHLGLEIEVFNRELYSRAKVNKEETNFAKEKEGSNV
jgi:hypothetical protein